MQKETIVLIDDEIKLAALVAKRIRTLGYNVTCFDKGEEALQAIEKAPPVLVLLDIWLPDISGVDLFKRLKGNPKTEKIPIIFFSADPAKEEFCRQELGGEGFIKKPYDPHELLALVQGVIKEKLHKQ